MRSLRVILATLALLAAAAPAAISFWTSPSAPGGAGQARAGSLPQANTPTAGAVGPTVTVRWAPSTLAGVTLGYRLYRDGVQVPCTPADDGNGNLECVEASVPPGVHQWTVATTLGTNWVGAQSNASAPITVYNDVTAPTTTASDSPAPNAAGWHNTSPVAVTLTATDNAGGSGVKAIRYTLDGSDPRSSATAITYTSPFDVASTTTVRYSAIDNANIEEAPGSHLVRIDQTPPTNSLSLTAVTGGAHLAGSTLWYRGVAAGSFRIQNAVADADSGPGGSATAALGGVSTGWTHAPSTVTTPAGGPYASNTFSWVAGTTSAPTEVVTGLDAADNGAPSAAISFTLDNTAPTSAASLNPAANASGWNNTSVQVTLSAADNAGGSGVDEIRYTTDGSDPRSSGTAATYSAPFTVTSTATVRFSATDNVGNVEAPKAQAVQIDSIAPVNSLSLQNVTGNVLLSGTTVFYRGVAAGGFRIKNSLADSGGSGADTSTTSALAGTSTGWSHTPSTEGNPFVSNPFSWVAGATSSPTVTVTGADAAGNTTPTTLTMVNDSTGPVGGASFPSAAGYASGSSWSAGCGTPAPDICGTPVDAGSGIASVSLVIRRASDNRCLNPANGNWTNGACGGGGAAPSSFDAAGNPVWVANMACLVDSFTLTITQTDNLTNATTVPAQAWQITSCAG